MSLALVGDPLKWRIACVYGFSPLEKTKLKNVCYDWEAQEKNDATSKLATEEQNVAALELLQNHMNTKP